MSSKRGSGMSLFLSKTEHDAYYAAYKKSAPDQFWVLSPNEWFHEVKEERIPLDLTDEREAESFWLQYISDVMKDALGNNRKKFGKKNMVLKWSKNGRNCKSKGNKTNRYKQAAMIIFQAQ